MLLRFAVCVLGFLGGAVIGEARAEETPRIEKVLQLGHTGGVRSVAFSPDGKTALSGSEDNTVRLWDLATGREIRKLVGHSDKVVSVAFSPDGKTVLSGSWDHTVRLWDLAAGREIRKLEGHSDWVNSVAFSPDGNTALSGSGEAFGNKDYSIRLWDLATGREIRKLEGHSREVTSVAFSPNGNIALSGSYDGTVRLWDLAAGREIRTLEGHSDWVYSVAFSPDGKTALSGSEDNTVRLWDLATGREIRKLEGHSDEVTSVAFSPDGKTALSGSKDLTVRLWDLATGREIRELVDDVSSVAFSPDGKTALSGSHDNIVILWDLATGREIRKSEGRSDDVSSVALSPDGKTALSGSGDMFFASVRLWDLATGREIRKLKGHSGQVTSVAFSPDGKTALSGSWDGTARLWDLATGREIRKLEGHSYDVSSVAFSPDGKTALSGSRDKTVRLWDLATGREIRKLEGHSYDVSSVAFSPDGKTALSGSHDNIVILWDLATGRQIHKLEGHSGLVTSVAFSPDGKTALSGSRDQTVRLWDLATGREIRKLEGHLSEVTSVAFSPDGRTALSGSVDKTASLWDLATGREIRKLEGHSDRVNSVSFSLDGKTALSGSHDGTLRLWNIQSGEELAALIASPDGEYMAFTPSGFFSASQRDTDMLAIVRGMGVTTIAQVHQSLFNPDLVREALAGDPDGEVKRAAEVMNLEKVLDSGPAPQVEIVSHPYGSVTVDLVTVAARITDRGKGIGRIEWRVNGITAGVRTAPAGPGPDYEVKQELALDPGENQMPRENRIEVIAYEGRNLLASLPARTTITYITYSNPADSVKPKLYILAIGINAYEDAGWAPPGSSVKLAFPPLKSSVPDAKAFSAEMEKAGAGQYAQVRVTLALDADATAGKLEETVRKLAGEIGPRDTFVLYAAAHGYSVGGNYYMIPQDYQGGPNPEALKARAIGQERLQDWIANRIKAKKALILLDTCESGALTGGYTKSRTEGPVSEAAVGRLHEATGRPVLTAASGGKSAYEGYKGHGVFTYALMEALHQGDANGNGKIEVSELAAHVEKRVPELFAELKQSGWVVKGAAAPAARGNGDDKQSAHFGSTGEDFAIVARLP